jgi:arylformamidase
MKIIDISLPITEHMQVYKDKEEKRPVFTRAAQHPNQSIQETVLTINLHTGTHVDAPLHIFSDGAGIEQYPLDKFFGQAQVLDLSHVTDCITDQHLAAYNIEQNQIILLKTRNSAHMGNRFDFDFVYLTDTAAAYLAAKQIKTVGIDALGIERNQSHHPTHRHLLSAQIPIIEGLQLRSVEAGQYTFIGFPIYLPGNEASLIRAVLIDQT